MKLFKVTTLVLLTAFVAFSQTVLPVKYSEHRFFLEPVTDSGEKVLFFTDTGGGLFMYSDTAERLKLEATGTGQGRSVAMPVFKKGNEIPTPLGAGGRLWVMDTNTPSPMPREFDSMLGQAWFADRIWTFDYKKRQMLLWDRSPKIIEKKSKHSVPVWFKTDDKGKRLASFPRIQIEVDGEVLDMLFDTGASTYLTKEALAELKDGRASARATGFITNVKFEQWRKNHPDWRVIEKAEERTGEAMIEARNIKIAGHTVERAWFTRRADKNFHEYMTGFMDKKVEGAIGGSLMYHFRVTVDYSKAVAVFEK